MIDFHSYRVYANYGPSYFLVCVPTADKPKFNNNVNYVEVNEQQDYEHSVLVRANPFVDNLVFSRVKETTNGSSTVAQDPIYEFENISWLFEPIPSHWSWSLSRDNEIVYRIVNASTRDTGLYVARVSNSLGDSLLFIRLLVKGKRSLSECPSINPCTIASSAIHSLQLYSSGRVVEEVQEGDPYFELRCEVYASPSITVKWTRHFRYKRLVEKFRWNTDPLTQVAAVTTAQPSNIIDNKDSGNESGLDWSRSNVSQYSSGRLLDVGQSIVSNLFITKVSLIDSGVYTCITPNDSKHISVRVRHRPRILYKPNTLMVATDRLADTVKFVCSAIAYPLASFNWTVNGNKMISEANAHDDDKYRVSTHKQPTETEMDTYHFSSELIVQSVTDDDYRSYKCSAFNHLGSDQVTFELVHKSKYFYWIYFYFRF